MAAPLTASYAKHGGAAAGNDGGVYNVVIASTIDTDPMRHIGRGDGADNLVVNMGIRRLTPLENERLMGWPEDWTRWTADDREVPDSHRYHMTGNGVVATVAEWIGHRLVAVDAAAV